MRPASASVPPSYTLVGAVLSLSQRTCGISLLAEAAPPRYAKKSGGVNAVDGGEHAKTGEGKKKAAGNGATQPLLQSRLLDTMVASTLMDDVPYEDENDELGNAQGRVTVAEDIGKFEESMGREGGGSGGVLGEEKRKKSKGGGEGELSELNESGGSATRSASDLNAHG